MTFRFKAYWRRLSLAQLFAVVSFGVIVTGTLVIGWWVSAEIETRVTHNAAVTTALYMNSFVAPEIQGLATRQELTKTTRASLDRLHRNTPLGQHVVSFKIWGPGGRIVYSSRPSILGRVFPETSNLKLAWQGEVTSEFSDLEDEEDALERAFGGRLLELYSPVREKGKDRIIAVAEFYTSAKTFEEQLFEAQVYSWLMVSGVCFVMFVLLFGIVRRGSQTISAQQHELQSRVKELSALLAQNHELNERVRRATNRATEVNERFLRRVSAELHDGPAQAIGFALLRLDALLASVGIGIGIGAKETEATARGTSNDASKPLPDAINSPEPHAPVPDIIRGALNDALQEIRNLSSGLALPELGNLSFRQTLDRVTRSHQRRTASAVELSVDLIPDQLPLPIKIGIYRFIQESLNNAYRHGNAEQQLVRAGCHQGSLVITISDAGPGFDLAQLKQSTERLGLVGMRERIESLGGRFSIDSAPGQGTRVTASLPLKCHNDPDE